MKKLSTLFLAVFLLMHAAAAQQKMLAKKNEVIIQFDPFTDVNAFIKKLNSDAAAPAGLEIKKTLSSKRNIYVLTNKNNESVAALPVLLRQQPGVKFAGWNEVVEFRDSLPNDPLFGSQWDMERIGLPDVWNISTGGLTANGQEIVVAVLDKGFDLIHEDIFDNVWINPGEIPWDGIDNDDNGYTDDVHGWNFRDSSPFFSVEKHGTNVSGIIGGKGNNGLGVAGINWNVKMMFLSVQYADEVVAAFLYAMEMRELYHQTNGEKGAFIVVTNGSFGIDKKHCSEQPVWGSLYDPLGESGILSVAATANENWNVEEVGDIPTSCPSEYLISVTSTDQEDNRVSNAAFGEISIDLGAPGKSTITTNPSNNYNNSFSGTSSACPHVAGSIALLYSLPCSALADFATDQPGMAARLVRDAILKSVDPVPGLAGKTVTGGRLNVYESMRYLHGWCIARTEERAAGDFKETYLIQKNLVRVYPNPASETLKIDYSNEGFSGVSIKVFNVMGQEITIPLSDTTTPFELQQMTIDVKDWPNGTYFIQLLDAGRKVVTKFVKI